MAIPSGSPARPNSDGEPVRLEYIPDGAGLDEFANEPGDRSTTYVALPMSAPLATTESIATRRYRQTRTAWLRQKAWDGADRAARAALDRGILLLASRRPFVVDRGVAVAAALAATVVGYGALRFLVWNPSASNESRPASQIVRSVDPVAFPNVSVSSPPAGGDAPAVVSPRRVADIETPPRPATAAARKSAAGALERPVNAAALERRPIENTLVLPPQSIDAVAMPLPPPPPSPPRLAETEAAVVPAPLAAATAPAPTGVDEVLASYRQSYNDLDATSVSRIWQGADQRALQRAFAGLRRQRLAFDSCDIDVTSTDRALAHCVGALSYVPKYGGAAEQRRSMEWTIYLQRHDGRWVIASVAAR